MNRRLCLVGGLLLVPLVAEGQDPAKVHGQLAPFRDVYRPNPQAREIR
jgi:hypothetical protein